MKLNNHPYRTVALLLLVMLAAACTGEDDFAAPPDEGTATAAPLTITVTDGAYAPAQSPDGGNTPDTRAVEREYGTEFTKGDRIGLYVVEKQNASDPADARRAFVHENLCLTHDGKGWTLPAGKVLTHRPPDDGEILYFAYYPYQSNMADKVDINAQGNGSLPTTEAHNFFSGLISGWTPATDQSTYAAYTANDLMVARGEVAKRTDGTDGSVLSFTMKHQMVLNIICVPMTKYTYEGTIDGVSTPMSCRLYSGLDINYSQKTFKGWINDNTYRYLVKPGSENKIEGFYYNSSLEKKNFKGTLRPGSPGKYVLLTVDEGKETVIPRPLQIGDFYMNDGGIIPYTTDMPANVQANCLGVVFWVGESEGLHWTMTAYKMGDRLLMRDHPGCVHGMVVALKDANQGAGAEWATGSGASEELYEWATGLQYFNAEESADWSAIEKSAVTRYGYCMSHLVRLYSTYNTTATFPAYNMISDYAALHPAPVSSSGWFMPGRGELGMLCYGKADNFTGNKDTGRRDLLNGLFPKVGGEAFAGSYWSTYEGSANKAWYLDFEGDTNYAFISKSETHKVRAVLAF